jgi:hypothetical protein
VTGDGYLFTLLDLCQQFGEVGFGFTDADVHMPLVILT